MIHTGTHPEEKASHWEETHIPMHGQPGPAKQRRRRLTRKRARRAIRQALKSGAEWGGEPPAC